MTTQYAVRIPYSAEIEGTVTGAIQADSGEDALALAATGEWDTELTNDFGLRSFRRYEPEYAEVESALPS